MTLADRLVVMNGGYAEQIGTPLEVYATPATTFVGGFIGSPPMNLMRGAVADDGQTVRMGDKLALTIAAESLHLFDADSGARLPGF